MCGGDAALCQTILTPLVIICLKIAAISVTKLLLAEYHQFSYKHYALGLPLKITHSHRSAAVVRTTKKESQMWNCKI